MKVKLHGVAIELTNICNLKCEICPSQNPRMFHPRKKGVMQRELFNKIIHELTTIYNPKELTIALSFGGESMLHALYGTYLTITANSNFGKINIYTNGTYLNKNMQELIVTRPSNNQILVHISIHNSLALLRTLRNAKEMYKESINVDNVSVRLSVHKEEFILEDLEKIGNKIGPYRLSSTRIMGENLVIPNFKGKDKCASPFSYIAILQDGKTLPCCRLLSPGKFSMGNINNNTIKEVFEGKMYTKLRNNDIIGTPCEFCRVKI